MNTQVEVNNQTTLHEQDLKFLRQKEVTVLIGRSKSSLRLAVMAGLLPPPVPLGLNASAYIEHEVLGVMSARIRGYQIDPFANFRY